MIEFDSLEKAIATYGSPEYQAAKKLLDGSVERDVRMVEGARTQSKRSKSSDRSRFNRRKSKLRAEFQTPRSARPN